MLNKNSNKCIDCIYCVPVPNIVKREIGFNYVYCCVVPTFLGEEFAKDDGMIQVDCTLIFMTESFAHKDIKCQSFTPYN